MDISLFQTISFKLARNSMMLALILGLIVSIGQVITDFSQHQKQVDLEINNMLSLIASPADRAVYLLDQSATEPGQKAKAN